MASKKKVSKTMKAKRKFRATSKWKDFRKFKYDEQGGRDPITLSKLPKMAHLHHKDLNPEHYENIENEGNFVLLQPTTHKLIHFCLTYCKKFHTLEMMDRLYNEVRNEAILNGFIDSDE